VNNSPGSYAIDKRFGRSYSYTFKRVFRKPPTLGISKLRVSLGVYEKASIRAFTRAKTVISLRVQI
jgi:hypothetical protein